MLVFNGFLVVTLFWQFYPHLGQSNTPDGHWFAHSSFFSVWGRCNFLILLPGQVVAAHLAPHVTWAPPVAWGSFYLSCLYFCVCGAPFLIGGWDQRPSGILVSPRRLRAGARRAWVALYLLLLLFCSFSSGELIWRVFFLAVRQCSRVLSALLNLVSDVSGCIPIFFYFVLFINVQIWFHVVLFPFMCNTPVKPNFRWDCLCNRINLIYFYVSLIVVVTFISDTYLRLLVNYFFFLTMSFFACGSVIVLEIFGFWWINFGYIFSIWIGFVLRV